MGNFRFAWIAGAALIIGVSGCAQIVGDMAIEYLQVHTDLRWTVRPKSLALDITSRTSKVGEALFNQELEAPIHAKLSAALAAKTPTPAFQTQRPDLIFEAGAVLLPVEGVTRGHTVFCDPRVGFSDNYQKLRACMIDKDSDGVFDTVSWALMSELTPLTLAYPEQPISVAYTVEQAIRLRLISIGPIITKSQSGDYRLAIEVNYGCKTGILKKPGDADTESNCPASSRMFDAYSTQFRESDLPITLEIKQARIEIVDIKREIATFRVIATMSGPLKIPYHGPLLEKPN